jgi:hypothetical protein
MLALWTEKALLLPLFYWNHRLDQLTSGLYFDFS